MKDLYLNFYDSSNLFLLEVTAEGDNGLFYFAFEWFHNGGLF
jgi:hypothetical protein